MANEPRPPVNGLLLVVLALLTGYLAWQITPLRQRVDTIERRLLEVRDRLFGEMERLSHEIDSLRARSEKPAALESSAAKGAEAEKSSGSAVPTSTPAKMAAAAPTPPTADFVRFFNKRLLSEDATIASLMASGTPLPEIARLTHHSIPYVVGKGAQIERMLAASPDTPPEALRAIRRSLAEAKELR
ncbi:MAG: hypothetical protein ACREQQ_13745 [Candidatus Binatia bacterium]